MLKWIKRKLRRPKFLEQFDVTIITFNFTVELFQADGLYYWGATDKASVIHQYLSVPYFNKETAMAGRDEFLAYVEDRIIDNY